MMRFEDVIPPFCSFYIAMTTTVPNTLSLHDALPICPHGGLHRGLRHHAEQARRVDRRPAPADQRDRARQAGDHRRHGAAADRKSTRLNSSHVAISYAVFCLKKKTNQDMS